MPDATTCSEEGCGEASVDIGRCSMHAQRIRRSGEAGPPGSVLMPREGSCEAPGCTSPIKAKLRCSMHYQRFAKHGSFDLPGKPQAICRDPDCDRVAYAKGWCQMHRKRVLANGSSQRPPTLREQGLQFLEGLTDPSGDCVSWPFTVRESGYGRLAAMGETAAHRVSARIHLGPPPPRRPLALHSCGKGHEGCVAPWHLYWGDYDDNARDRDLVHGTGVRGSLHWYSKLTESDINPIRNNPRPHGEIAEAYGVTPGTIYMVQNGLNWKHVPWE